MTTSQFEFQVVEQPNLLDGLQQANINGFKVIRRKNNDIPLICVRHGPHLIAYQFDGKSDNWKLYWKEQIFDADNDFNETSYPWFVDDVLGIGSDLIVIRTPSGLAFLNPRDDPRGLDHITHDGRFDLFNRQSASQIVLMGHFYVDKSLVGLFSRNDIGDVKMYVIKKHLVESKDPYPLYELQLQFSSHWSNPDTNIFITDLRHNGKDVFVLQTVEGLEVFEIDESYKLNEIIRSKNMGRKSDTDRLLFGNFVTKVFKDIIYLNDDGLSLYQYNSEMNDFALVDHNIEFSGMYGWRPSFSDSMTVVDLNKDGIDELIFTGTDGLTVYTFNPSNKKWKNILNSSHLGGLLRYATAIGLVNIGNKPILFTQDTQGSFHWMNVVSSSSSIPIPDKDNLDLIKPLQSFNSFSAVPSTISRISHYEVPTLRWTEQWDVGFLKEAVRPETGQVEFSIPLIKAGPIPTLQFAIGISYNSQDSSSGLLGNGWTIPIATYYIAVDRKGSIFPVDSEYYLIREGRITKLFVKAFNFNSMEFIIKEQPDLRVTYDLKGQRWVVENDVEQAMYGLSTDKKFGAVQTTLKWPNWRGSGKDTSQLEEEIQRWYLYEHRAVKDVHSLFYKYAAVSSTIGGKYYTVSVRLISIEDGKQFQANFNYAPKTTQEYKPLSPINADKVITFPIQLVYTHYLESCTIQTSVYRQRIYFDYDLRNGSRLLVQMSQPIKNHIESLFRFHYKTELENLVMSMCSFMNNSSVSFDYTKTTSSVPPFSLQYHVGEPPQIIFGPDYAVMAYKSRVEVNFRLTNVALTIPVFKGTTITDTSKGNVESFMIRAFRNSFVVTQTTDNNVAFFSYKRTDDTWSEIPKIEIFNKNSLIGFGASFCAIVEPDSKKLIIMDIDEDQSEWKRLSLDLPYQKSMKRFEVQNQLIVGHNDEQLYVLHKEVDNKWVSELVDSDVGQVYENTQKTIDLFDIEPNLKEKLTSVFKRDSLQLFNNLIIVTSFQEEGGTLISNVKCYLLDANHKVATTYVEKTNREKLSDLKMETESGGTNVTMKYHFTDGKYFIKIVDFTGKLADAVNSISNTKKREDAINQYLMDLNNSNAWKAFFKNSILFDHAVYRTQLSKDGIFIGNDIFIRLTGTEWEKETRPPMEYVRLGESFMLGFHQKDSKSVYLYRQLSGKIGEIIQHINLNGSGQFINRYPAYLAYHSSATQITVLTFKSPNTLGKEERYTGEELLFESNLTNLMSVAKLNTKNGLKYEWRVRSLSNFMESKPYSTVERSLQVHDNITRATAYERSSKYKREVDVLEESLIIIPGGNKSISGWTEYMRMNNMKTTDITMSTNHYNAAGQLVSVETNGSKDGEKESKKNESETTPGHQIFDKSGRWEITNFIPHKVSDDEGVYFGFELYEENQGMEFDQSKIVRGKSSFTGSSYLNLKNNSKLIKVLSPKDTNNIFIASCFVRSNSYMVLKHEVQYLRVFITASNIRSRQISSKVLRQSGEWYYLESYIDLITLTREHGSLRNLQITIEVTSDSADVIDLDHVRFSPLTQNFQATVYNPLNGKAMAKISDNGLVSRTIFDNQLKEIAELKTDEQIDHFTRTTKTGELIPSPNTLINKQPSSKIKFEPESGFYEHFDATAFSDRWSVSDQRVWQISKGQLIHRGIETDVIVARTNLLNASSVAIRFGFNLRLLQSAFKLRWSDDLSISFNTLTENQATLKLNSRNLTVIDNLPVIGELLIFIEKERIVTWIDGVLVIDQGHGLENLIEPWTDFKFEMTNYVVIEDLFIMNRPQIRLEYLNGWGEVIQVLKFENDKVMQVSQKLYDELGRNVIATKPTKVSRDTNQTLFAFYPEFVQNEKPTDENSVWKTGVLKGEVDTLNTDDAGVPYTRTEYDKNPLNQKISEGLPGKDSSTSGPNAKRFSKDSNVPFMSYLFPDRLGYRQQVEILPNGSAKIAVFDSKKNIVARYVRVSGFNHHLSTSEYDEDNRLIKILPPLYHEMVKTADKVTPYINGNRHLTETEKSLQQTYGTHFEYDKNGNLIEKRTPDSGTIKYMYTLNGDLRFMITMGVGNIVERVTYFIYDEYHQLVQTGYLSIPLSVGELKDLVNKDDLPNAVDYQKFQYSDGSVDPTERGYKKSLVTYNDLEPVQEIVRFNTNQEVLSREVYSLPQTIQFDVSSPMISVQKDYNRNAVSSMLYPGIFKGKPFKLVYTYNKLGNIIGLGTEYNRNCFALFDYHINGLVALETHTPTSVFAFSRTYNYNSPGFLERISDPYLTEDLSYTHGGYGVNGFGDGTVLLTTFNPKWLQSADQREFRVDNIDENYIPATCIQALKSLGYIDSLGNPIKLYIENVELSIPIECRGVIGLRMAKLLAEKHIPRFYGFRFAYGNYRELINGKYFTDRTYRLIEPLQEHSFSKFIPSITVQQSKQIFDFLSRYNYILLDQRPDRRSAIGKRGSNHFFRDDNLKRDLEQLTAVFGVFTSAIISLMTSIVSQRKSISLDIFQQIFLKWLNFNNYTTKELLQKAYYDSKVIFEMLNRNGYTTEMAFKLEFRRIFSNYKNVIPDIVRILNNHFTHELGATSFDVESCNIDANGNHRHFYTGFERYEFVYKNGSNQISDVKIDNFQNIGSDRSFKMIHDIDGNVVQAMHKNIKEIQYNRASQKTTSILMADGRKVLFYYDAQGERILKRVILPSGVICRDTYYIRDEEGRVLLDRRITYLPAQRFEQVIVTMYIYGPRGLVGFIRNDKFHSVITDHSGSVRLIIRDGKVISAFDYLPYGQLMRAYGSNSQDMFAYRYTGQEYDEETGLYNYHARLYDPEIGRFYQLDPQAQYYSPYKYAGNSPVLSVDPDREFLIKLNVGLGLSIGGAYLGGASVNNRWNPVDSNFKDSGAWIGIVGGGIGGALLPTGLDESIAPIDVGGTVTLGAGGMYLSSAAVNGNWNPEEWKWDSPETSSSLFQGFAAGGSLAGGFNTANKFSSTLSTTAGEKTTSISSYGSAVMVNEGNAAFWEWDFSNPGTWQGLLDGFDGGVGFPTNIVDVGRSLKSVQNTPSKLQSLLSKIENIPSTLEGYTQILKNPKHPLYKVATITASTLFFLDEANGDFDVTNWKNSLGTYHGLVKDVFFGKDINERITTTANMLNKPTPVEPNSYTKIPDYRKRRFALPHLLIDQSNTSTAINLILGETNSTEHNHSNLGIPVPDSGAVTSSGVQVAFWPFSVFRTIKSTLNLANFIHKDKPMKNSGFVPAFPSPSTPPIPFISHSLNDFSANPGIQFNQFEEDSLSILEMGDQWLANTNMQGNFLWIFILIQKLFGIKSNKSHSLPTGNYEHIAFEIQAYEIFDAFIENAMSASVSCGIERGILKIINSGELDHVVNAIKIKLMTGRNEEIVELLLESLIGRYYNKILKMSTPKQANKFKKIIQKILRNLENKLINSCCLSYPSVMGLTNVKQNNLLTCSDRTTNCCNRPRISSKFCLDKFS